MLRVPSSGIFASSVTWEDVQTAVADKFGSDVKFGADKTIVPIGAEIGLQSLLGVVDAHWTKASGTLPAKLVLKVATPLPMLAATAGEAKKMPPEMLPQMMKCLDEFVEFLTPCHNAEIFFYEQFEKLGKNVAEVPRYYFGRKLTAENPTKGFLGMEFIDGVHCLTPAQNFSDAQINEVLKALARLQAAFVDVGDDVVAQAPHQGLAGLYATIKDFLIQLNNYAFSQMPGFEPLTTKLGQHLPSLISTQNIDALPKVLGMKRVLVHGDFWSTNFLWRNGSAVHLEKIVDFQMSHFGLAATDLTRLFNTCLSPQERKAKWQHYLRVYYDELVKELHGREPPFSYENLELSYRLSYPRTSTLLLPAMMAVVQKVAAIPDVATKNAALGVLIPKVMGIYEDIVDFHEHRPKLVDQN